MRGKVVIDNTYNCISRITPAYAGKRCSKLLRTYNDKDHPRLCGEKGDFDEVSCWQAGSPPPMRGKDQFATDFFRNSRITPAYAGKRFLVYFSDSGYRDHPRLCGEKTKKIPKQRYFFHQPASFSFSLQYT